MKPGQLTKVIVEDVTFLVRFTWGDLKALQRDFTAMDTADIKALDRILEDRVLPAVVKVEGLVDSDEVPVDELTLAVLDEYPPDLTLGLVMGLMDVGKRLEAPSRPPA